MEPSTGAAESSTAGEAEVAALLLSPQPAKAILIANTITATATREAIFLNILYHPFQIMKNIYEQSLVTDYVCKALSITQETIPSMRDLHLTTARATAVIGNVPIPLKRYLPN
ncbi:MAG: hypothetical protein PHT34_02180 [Oscillospiraceae bacterium]|nr:hypothetical protein [Oscillospiraceae bacterium]